MSIVYDYLKQIQEKKSPEKNSSEVPTVKKSAGFPLGAKIVVGVLGCLILGAGLYFFLPKAEKTTVKIYQAPEKPRTVQAVAPDLGFLLEGIIYNPSRPFAIIDGKMLEVGGRVGDFEVAQITPDTVLLKNFKDGTSRTIRL